MNTAIVTTEFVINNNLSELQKHADKIDREIN